VASPHDWTCEIEWRFLGAYWGFRASATPEGSTLRRVFIAEAGAFRSRAERNGAAAQAALATLVADLERAGWRPGDPGTPLDGCFAWTGPGEPARLDPHERSER
jgi:hypothetical protein